MTKEELKQEADYSKIYSERDFKLSIMQNPNPYKAFIAHLGFAYLAGAEPREKQVEIDAKQIRALQKQNGELTDELAKKADTNHQLVEQMAKLSEKNAELKQAKEGKVVEHFEAQIEKMKIKWHDLEKDPNDLPKDYKTMCICLSDFGSKYEPVPRVCVGYCDSLGWSDYMGSSLYSTVRYWCELPKGR